MFIRNLKIYGNDNKLSYCEIDCSTWRGLSVSGGHLCIHNSLMRFVKVENIDNWKYVKLEGCDVFNSYLQGSSSTEELLAACENVEFCYRKEELPNRQKPLAH
jgi:hypothetical protein